MGVTKGYDANQDMNHMNDISLSQNEFIISGNDEFETTKGGEGETVITEGMTPFNAKQIHFKKWFEENTEFDEEICCIYFQMLMENGFDTMHTVKNITDSELKEIGIDK